MYNASSLLLNGRNSSISRSEKQCILGPQEYLQLFLYTLVIIFGVFGNASICYCFGLFHRYSRKSVSEVLILYLAVVDFCASVFTPFVFIYWLVTCNSVWHFGTFGCKVLPFLGRVFINISVGIICILALDRYRAICRPFKGQFKKKYIHISVFLAILSASLCEVYYLDALTDHKKPLPHGSVGCLVTPSNKMNYRLVTTIILLARDVIFVLIFTITSTQILINLTRRSVYVTSSVSGNVSMSRDGMEHVIRIIITMQIVFIVLVLPRDLLHIIFTISWMDGDGIPYTKRLVRLNDALKVMQTANCCANVFIYAKMHDRFRQRVVALVQTSIACGVNSPLLASQRQHMIPADGKTTNNNNKTYSRCLLKNARSLGEVNNRGSYATGETTVYEMEYSPAILDRKSQFPLLAESNGRAANV